MINHFGILKECRNKFETLISKDLLIKRNNQILNKQYPKQGIINTLNFLQCVMVHTCFTMCKSFVTCNFIVIFLILIYNCYFILLLNFCVYLVN